MYETFLIGLQGDFPHCKHACRPNVFQKEAAQQVSPCKPLPFDILSMNLYVSWVLSKLLELQCNWKYAESQAGALKNNYILYTIYPPARKVTSVL